VPSAKVQVSNPGVDLERFKPASRDVESRQRLGWGDHPVILTVGRLQKRKGHAQLIAALPGIIEKVPRVLYAIVGTGEERAALEKLAHELNVKDHVQFLGEQHHDDLVAAVQQCDVFALPNIEVAGDFEGFGMVLVEAQACGKPVVAGRSGGTNETMLETETGHLVNAGNKDELTEVISGLLTDELKQQRMGAAGRRWAEERFDWNQLSERLRTMFAFRFDGRNSLRKAAA
jgi:phosphatidylinositol alpha-1,6-mannosyltransferase